MDFDGGACALEDVFDLLYFCPGEFFADGGGGFVKEAFSFG